MGLWDSIKSIALSAKCGVGWHAGEYENVEGQPKCLYSKICPDCFERVTKVEHSYDEWIYLYANNCRCTRTCIHCGYTENSIIHNYQNIAKDEHCHVIQECDRCHDRKIGAVEHNWIKVPFTDKEITANGKKKCRDCGYIGS